MKFEEIRLKPEILKAISHLGFVDMTEIQEKCIPAIMNGEDIVGQSQTGSGKTAVFALPILNNIVSGGGVQAIILTPTRELCVQVHESIKSFAKFSYIKVASVYGGVGIGPQIDELKRADIVVGTPGRVLDHLDRRSLDLSKVKYFVLDEADRMLEMGFIDDVKQILKSTPKEKHSLMFSATMPTQIKTIIAQHFKNPRHIKGQTQVDRTLLRQVYYNIRSEQKFSLLVHLLKKNQGVALIFCATRHEVDVVEKNLKMQGIKAMAIHGGLTQSKRLHVVEMLKNEQIKTLVATDVAARGLDIRNITHVFNYDLPQSSEDYIHRIGRTARAGEDGDAVTLLTQNDYGKFQAILSDRTLNITKADIPEFEMVRFERPQSRGRFSSGGFQQRPRSSGGFHSSGSSPRAGFSRSSSQGSGRSTSHGGRFDRSSSSGRNETTQSREERRMRREGR